MSELVDDKFLVITKNQLSMSIRIYSYKDVVMLMAAKTILQSLLNCQGELMMARSKWTMTYVIELIVKVDAALENFLGLDTKQSLRHATKLLKEIKEPVIRDLGFIKTQIDADFGTYADEMLKMLGLNQPIQHLDQESLIELLYSFKKGMTFDLRYNITEKGTDPILIDTIIGYATQLQEANLNQEGLKTATKEVTEEAVDAFNQIYSELIAICKIASKFYQEQPLKKDQFSFRKVVKNMGVAFKKEEEPVVI